MSHLLEQAIIDATALKEAAIKNAESSILEKYSSEIKTAVDSLLSEQEDAFTEDLGLEEEDLVDPGASLPRAPAAEGMCPCPDLDEEVDGQEKTTAGTVEVDLSDITPGDGGQQDREDLFEEVEIDFEALERQMLGESDENQEKFEVTAETVAEILAENADEDDEDDEESIQDSLIDQILEKLTVDINPQKSGYLETPISDIDLAVVQAQATEELVDEEAENMQSTINKLNDPRLDVRRLEEAVDALGQEKEELTKQVAQLNTAKTDATSLIMRLKDKLEEVNLSNAKLLYTNRILSTDSLNERQKNKIVESLAKADSVEKARVMYETLQSTVGASTKERKPESLSEVVTRRKSSVLRAQRADSSDQSEATYTRMKKLAGLK